MTSVFENEIVEKSFDLNNKINLPSKLVRYQYNNYNVFIQPQKAQWCIIPRGIETEIFDLFYKGYSVNEVINKLQIKHDLNPEKITFKISVVLAEIEDKEFFDDFNFDYNSLRFKELKIFLTNSCNLKCKHCYKYNDPKDLNELNYVDWSNVIEQHSILGGDSVLITGGEPTLRKKLLFKLLQKIKSYGLKSILLTNGVLLSEEYVNKIAPFLDEIQVSIDGPDEKTADNIRGKGNYKLVTKALNILKSYDLKIFIAMTPLLDNVEVYEKKLKFFVSTITSGSENIYFRLSKEILEGRLVHKLSKEDQMNFEGRILKLEEEVFGKEYQNQIDAAFYDSGLKIESCGYGSSLFIEPNGDVYPCDLYKNKILANIKKNSLIKIRDILIEEMKKSSVDNLYPCSTCDLKYLCGGPCRFELKEKNGKKRVVNCSDKFKNSIINRLIKMNKWKYNFEKYEIDE